MCIEVCKTYLDQRSGFILFCCVPVGVDSCFCVVAFSVGVVCLLVHGLCVWEVYVLLP